MADDQEDSVNQFGQSLGENIYQNVLAIRERVSRSPTIARQIENIASSIMKDVEEIVYHSAECGFNEAIVAIFNSQSRISGIRVWEYVDCNLTDQKSDIHIYLASNPGITEILQTQLSPMKVSLEYHSCKQIYGIIRVSW